LQKEILRQKASVFIFQLLLSSGINSETLFKTCDWLSCVYIGQVSVTAGNPYVRGRLSAFDLLVLTSLDQLILMLKTLFTFLQNKLPKSGGQLY